MPNWTRQIGDTKIDKHLYEVAKQLQRVASAAAHPATTTTTTTV